MYISLQYRKGWRGWSHDRMSGGQNEHRELLLSLEERSCPEHK